MTTWTRADDQPVLLVEDEAHQIITNPELKIGDVAPGQPVRLHAVNPWLRWANWTARTAIAGWLVALAVLVADGPHLWWFITAAVGLTVPFVVVVIAHQHREKRPAAFVEAP